MDKLKHEPGEPTPEDLAGQFSEILGKLHSVRELFLAKQQVGDLLGTQTDDMFQRFETEQIELILGQIENNLTIPWRAHPESVGEEASDAEATADTYIDVVEKSIVRYEATEAQGTEQIEIIMTYRVNETGKLERLVDTEVEEIADSLEDFNHPAFVPLLLPDGEKVNMNTAHEGTLKSELELKQAIEFVTMIKEIVSRLTQIYNQRDWHVMLDTDRTPNDVESGDYRAVYKIERIDSD